MGLSSQNRFRARRGDEAELVGSSPAVTVGVRDCRQGVAAPTSARSSRWGAILGLVLLGAGSVACGDERSVAALDDTTSTSALSRSQCEAPILLDNKGKIEICHSQSSKSLKFKFVKMKVTPTECVNHVATHLGASPDFVTGNDKDCSGNGCLEPTTPCDPTVPCCDGLTCTARNAAEKAAGQGICTDVNACINNPCGAHEDCRDLAWPAEDDASGRVCTCSTGFKRTDPPAAASTSRTNSDRDSRSSDEDSHHCADGSDRDSHTGCGPAVTGACVAVCDAALNCNDQNACTTDSCDAAGGCLHQPVNSDDGNACTVDSCDARTGVAHTPISVDDNNRCTVDSCNPASGPVHLAVSPDDGNACTADSCDALAGIRNTPISVDDGNLCTVDSCNPASGPVHRAISPDDGNACTADSCDALAGIRNTPISVDDGNLCTTDTCNPASGPIHVAISPDDGNACTIDTCDPRSGVAHSAVSVDDGNLCTADSCNPASGPLHLAISSDDGSACTIDTCDPKTGAAHTPIGIDDNNLCTADSCDPASGAVHVAISVDDNNACTEDSCDALGGIAHTGIAFDDDNLCTTDSCDPAIGPVHVPVFTDDADACTEDSCDPQIGIENLAISFDDNDLCTADSCEADRGPIHVEISFDDGNACTADSCSPSTGPSNVPISCDDGSVCTIDRCDVAIGCTFISIICDDGDACTADFCDATTGCGSADSGQCFCGNGVRDPGEACDDGNAIDGDGCDTNCTLSVTLSLCGNGALDASERCDDGNRISGDGCPADCSAIEDGFTCNNVGAPCEVACQTAGDLLIRNAEDIVRSRNVCIVDGTLEVFDSDLTTLSLPNLQQVNGAFLIRFNSLLQSINVPKLTFLGFSLGITDNPVLTSLSGFDSLSFVPHLGIFQNASLPQCDVEAFFARLSSLGPTDCGFGCFDNNGDTSTCLERFCGDGFLETSSEQCDASATPDETCQGCQLIIGDECLRNRDCDDGDDCTLDTCELVQVGESDDSPLVHVCFHENGCG